MPAAFALGGVLLAGLVVAGLVASGWVPSGLVPSGLVPSRMVTSGSLSSRPVAGGGEPGGAGSTTAPGHRSATSHAASGGTVSAEVTPDSPATVSGPAVLHDPEAARHEPTRLVAALSDLRARAWTTASMTLLETLDAPGSGIFAADRAALARARERGLSYEGVRFVVKEATCVAEDGDRATIRAEIDTSSYGVRSSAGDRDVRAAVRGHAILLDLLWSGTGWQVAEVRSP